MCSLCYFGVDIISPPSLAYGLINAETKFIHIHRDEILTYEKMGRNSGGVTVDANGELRILLVVTVIVGLLLMFSLLMCYACVLKRLCCGTPRERAKNIACARRTESYPMGDVTLLSQPTESERV